MGLGSRGGVASNAVSGYETGRPMGGLAAHLQDALAVTAGRAA